MRSLDRILIGIMTLTLFGPGTVKAQTPRTKSIDPFALASEIVKATHNRTVIDLISTWQQLGIEPGEFEECGDCEVYAHKAELNGIAGAEALIKLTKSNYACRYLVFTRTAKDWKFLGHVDHDFNRYQMARHRVASVKGRRFLVIRGQEGSGSGFALYSETWYSVGNAGVKPVLAYPVEGNTYPWPSGLGRSFKAAAVPEIRTNRITVHYTVSYTTLNYIKEDLKKLFVNQHRVTYVWDKQAGQFIFDHRQSNISPAEIDALANIETEDNSQPATKIGNTTFYSMSQKKAFVGGGYEVFLKFNLRSLIMIARGRVAKEKEWLRQFLADCQDTSEKKALMKALQHR